MKYTMITMALAGALLSTACVSSEDPASAAGDNLQSLKTDGGPEALYKEKCGMCHRDNGMGTFILSRRVDPERAWLENRDDLGADFVKTVVRDGFGVMFPMSRAEVSDPQLETIAEYLAGEE